jgi:BirA family biotin operon repressor/biotin-[acetyl-CoA-carboxylase] ligase
LYKIPANTLFVGKNLVFVPECHSTNTIAMELGQHNSAIEGTLVITDRQVTGRGQRGSSWISEPGKNLTLSLIFKPTFLKPDQQFWLTRVIALGIADYVRSKVKGSVKVKWPNDVLVEGNKVCGILIENSISGSTLQFSVVGIGLNINQLTFYKLKATSLKLETGFDYSLQDELHALLQVIEIRYLQLREGKRDLLEGDYLKSLYRMGESQSFNTSTGSIQGIIVGVDLLGRLLVQTDKAIQAYDLKEIRFADHL